MENDKEVVVNEDKDYKIEIDKLKAKIEILEREKAELKEVEVLPKGEKPYNFLEGVRYDY